MRAIVCTRHGGPEVLRLVDRPPPPVGAGEVLIRVRAAAVNPGDLLLRRGGPWPRFGAWMPRRSILGFEVAGEVVEVDSAVTSFAPGDRVMAVLAKDRGGGHAELVAVPAGGVGRAPAGITWEEAATLPLAGLTALQTLRDLARLQPGAAVLIHGAAGGVGSVALQIARAMGARVTATCRPEHFDHVCSLGAERAIDYRRVDLGRERGRFGLIFDVAARRTFWECRGALAPGGLYVTTMPLPLTNLLAVLLTPCPRGRRARLVMARPRGADLAAIAAAVERGDLRPIVGRTFPLAEAAEAHAALERGGQAGKIVLTVAAGR